MDWVTAFWAMLIGGCVAMALPHLLVGIWLRRGAHLCFVELKTSLDKKLPAVKGDPVQMQQVLVNLIVNAFDAMRDAPVSRRKVEISTKQNGDGTVRTSVRDFGVGISRETSERMFEQFFTTKTEGLGMGLAIVRSIAELHGGKIEAENVEGDGARFSFTLPTSREIPK
jgi:two-component system, LuxR family, sensor kinase FixL